MNELRQQRPPQQDPKARAKNVYTYWAALIKELSSIPHSSRR